MNERPVIFGSNRHLVGVLSAASPAGKPGPGILMWNAGLLHHIGPYRLYVDLARRLASLGFPSLRFDLSGLGDSAMPVETRPHREQVLVDIGAAVDRLLEHKGVDAVVLVGLCSGADDAHRVAVTDTRVCGAVLLDGYGYPTARFYRRRYAQFLSSPSRVVRFIAGRSVACMSRLLRRQAAEPALEDQFAWQMPPRDAVMRDLQALVDRGVRLYSIYSGEVHTYYNYADQFRDMFPDVDFRGRVTYEYFSRADHTFSDLPARIELVDRICHWMHANFGDG